MIQAMTMVLDFAPEHWSTGTRLVAIALADRVNGDTLECWPSVADLSRRTGLKERAVQRHLRALEEDGTISNLGQRITKTGSAGSNVWRWNLWITMPEQREGGARTYTRWGARKDTPPTKGGVHARTPEPLSLTTMNEPIVVILKSVDNR